MLQYFKCKVGPVSYEILGLITFKEPREVPVSHCYIYLCVDLNE